MSDYLPEIIRNDLTSTYCALAEGLGAAVEAAKHFHRKITFRQDVFTRDELFYSVIKIFTLKSS